MNIRNDFMHSLFVKAVSYVRLGRREIIRGNWNGCKCICLSFDCDYQEDMKTCRRIVELLRREDLLASFAVPGHLVIAFPEVVEEIIKNGHEIVNHTLSHPSNFRNLPFDNVKSEVKRFQDFMVKTYGYLPKGFRSPHGLRRRKPEIFNVLRELGMYDSSLVGHGVIYVDGVFEIPLTPCPEHPLMAFDTYHHFRFPIFLSSEMKFLKLWNLLLRNRNFVNVFLDPVDFKGEARERLFKEMIREAKEAGFTFNQMVKIYDGIMNIPIV